MVSLLLPAPTALLLLLVHTGGFSSAFCPGSPRHRRPSTAALPAVGRRDAISLAAGSGGGLGGLLGGLGLGGGAASAATPSGNYRSAGPTNEVVRVVNGIKHRRLGGSDIVVSEVGLGTQRWASADSNAPDEDLCMKFMDEAIIGGGVNLLDTAEQYPIPSGGRGMAEGGTEELIGRWMRSRKVKRENVVIATKITGGANVTPKNIKRDCEGSLKRLGTDYIDVYQTHWPARYSPQANWGQSLKYNQEVDASAYRRGGPTSFEELCVAMEGLIVEGKIRGWGLCNDNAYGLTGCTRAAKALGTTPPCSIQGDFSMIDRKSEENGVAEAASPYNENVGFMSYNALAGGVLTGKYSTVPAAVDDPDRARGEANLRSPRGRMDNRGWGQTLYRYRTYAALSATEQYKNIAEANGMSLAEMSLRWCRQRDMLTTTLVGHSDMGQLRETLKFFREKKPLPDQVMWDIDVVHMRNRTPIFSSNRVGRDWNGEGEIGEPIP
mmetsp:Transcript_12429/g.24762  ORF Transcript_12429/g.24762 Transcript_12429/m.24762 type:complete len:494 (+) Transcript_12429:62-1543(+)